MPQRKENKKKTNTHKKSLKPNQQHKNPTKQIHTKKPFNSKSGSAATHVEN